MTTRCIIPAASLLLLALALAGCANSGAGAPVSVESIVNGTRGGDPAVVAVVNRRGGLCSGALIDPRVVLTAKHCVQNPGAAEPSAPSALGVVFGDSAFGGRSLPVQSVYTTPGSYRDDGFLSGLVGVDVAVLVLSSGVSDVDPIPVRRTPPTDLRGQTITASGFGQTPDGRTGVKYTATGTVTGVDGDVIYVGSLICQGDSGGPMITAEREVAGVVSFGNGSCGNGLGAYNAVYNFLDMVDDAIEEGGGCVNDGEEVCDGRDNDCNGQVDEICTPIGGDCTEDAECVGTTCRDTPAGRICTAECDARRPGLGCGEGFYCARDGETACLGYCTPTGDVGATLPIDATCESDAECVSLHCVDPGDGRQRCLQPCEGDTGMCLAGEVCVATPGTCGSCVRRELVGGVQAGLGEPCAADGECASGQCVDDDGARYCTRSCDEANACAEGFHCRAGQCVRGRLAGVGEGCVTNEDCGSNTFCATQGSRSWCTSLCSESSPCADGFTCVDAGGVRVCAPESGLVGDSCTADEMCLSGNCSDAGICTRECGPDVACGTGLECRRSADGLGASCDLPRPVSTEGGGCAVSAGARTGLLPVLVVLGALALAAARRRREMA